MSDSDYLLDTLFNCSDFLALTLIIYDTMLTLSDEIRLVWKWPGKFTLGSLLYVLARYGTVIQLLFYAILEMNVNSDACTALSVVGGIADILADIGTQGFLLARAHAVTPDHPILILILALIFSMNQTLAVIDIIHGILCDLDGASLDTTLDTLSCMGTLIFDAGVMIATICHLRRVRLSLMESDADDSDSCSLTFLFFRQGVLRFGIISIWNIVSMVVYKAFPSDLDGIDSNPENAISSILMCHFFLQLRDYLGTTNICFRPLTPASTSTTLHQINESIMGEFGDSDFRPSASSIPKDTEEDPRQQQ